MHINLAIQRETLDLWYCRSVIREKIMTKAVNEMLHVPSMFNIN